MHTHTYMHICTHTRARTNTLTHTHTPGAASAPFDEELNPLVVTYEDLGVLTEERGPEWVINEGAGHEEGTAATEERCDERHVEKVAPGGNVRHLEVKGEEDPGDKEEI